MYLEENERIDDLEYKGLKLIQDKNGFCFGIDSVLLSDFAKNLKKDSICVDIGTGTGIIAILLCEKSSLKKIYGIEVQKDMAKIAKKNSILNKLDEKFEVINVNIKDVLTCLEKNSVDVIVTNPPYKKINTGKLSDDEKNLISRHEVACTLGDIIQNASSLLKDLGEFYMVHRAERIVDIMCELRKYKLEPKELKFVHSKNYDKPTLVLVKAIKNAKPFLKIDRPLVIYREDGEYTDEVLKIYNKERRM